MKLTPTELSLRVIHIHAIEKPFLPISWLLLYKNNADPALFVTMISIANIY
ncbi:hypothetical protein J500_2152 [Acinetobacter sp. 479375]|nr:hypothetical protein J500_2152 [Acinetobacter sp. 479375]